MKSLGLERVFFTQLLLRIAAAMVAIGAAFYFNFVSVVIPVISFSIYSFYHHFFSSKDLYRLRSEYKRNNLKPEEALEKYHLDMCMIHLENSVTRTLWQIALFFILLSSFLSLIPIQFYQLIGSCFTAIAHLLFLIYETVHFHGKGGFYVT